MILTLLGELLGSTDADTSNDKVSSEVDGRENKVYAIFIVPDVLCLWSCDYPCTRKYNGKSISNSK